MGDQLSTLWEIQPHTSAKHEILQRYLGAWFAILGSRKPRIIYLDGFCGPGRYSNGELGSPLIALIEALKHKALLRDSEVMFLCIDERQDRIEHLRQEIKVVPLPSNYNVLVEHGEFQVIVSQLLIDLTASGNRLAPTFAFIDPFGWSGVPFDLVGRLLQNPSTEVFINVMADSVNRFVEHPDPQTQSHIIDLFGTDRVLEVVKSAGDRLTALRCLYQDQLRQYAQFVRFFEMRNQQNRVIYYLFFATNHRLGHAKMKEAFWRIDSSSGFTFSDKTNPDQMVLFDFDPSADLARDLQSHFSGQTLCSENVIKYVEDQTPFTAKHGRSALNLLEQEASIQVESLKRDGSKRTRGFPDGVIMKFI